MAATGSPKVLLTAAEIEDLRHATNIVKAAIHPDTQKPIPMPMRITFFLPGNFPINLGYPVFPNILSTTELLGLFVCRANYVQYNPLAGDKPDLQRHSQLRKRKQIFAHLDF